MADIQLDLFMASAKSEESGNVERPKEIKVSAPTPFKPLVTEEEPNQEEDNEEKSLSTRQWRTHDLIVANSQNGKITTQRDIYNNYPYDRELRPDGYRWKEKSGENHDHCTSIWEDINKINASSLVHKIIIPKNFTYKVAESQEEVKEFIDEYYFAPAMARLWRYSNLRRKARRDGQGRLPFKDKSKEREYFESFIKKPLENIVDQYLQGE